MADTERVTCLSLFSGIGGLDIGVDRALGGRLRVLGYCEREAYPAAVLVARMEAADLEPAPVWCGDLADMDLAPFVGVDLVTLAPAMTAPDAVREEIRNLSMYLAFCGGFFGGVLFMLVLLWMNGVKL